MLKLTKFAVATAVMAAMGVQAHADSFVITLGDDAQTLNLALNNGVTAWLKWRGVDTQTITFNGQMQEFPVLAKTVTVSTTSNSDEPITSIVCVGSGITSIDVSNTTSSLQELNCMDNELTSVTFGSNVEALAIVNVACNPLTEITFPTACPALTTLICASTDITALPSASTVPALKSVWCQDTPISELKLTDYKSLTELYANNCQLTRLTVPSSLKTIYVDHNSTLESLILTAAHNIETISADNCSLTKLSTYRYSASTLKNMYINDNFLGFQNFPSITDMDNWCVSPQGDIALPSEVLVGTVTDLSAYVNRNAWSVTINENISWQTESGATLSEGVDFEHTGTGLYKWLKPVGKVQGILTDEQNYPGVTLQTSVINVVDEMSGINELATASADVSISSENGQLVVESSTPVNVTVVSANGQTIINQVIPAGRYTKALPAGVYVVNNQKVVVGN